MNRRHLLALSIITFGSAPALAQLGAPPVPPQNPITEQKRILGKALFWDEQLSSTNTVACGTCHIPAQGGSDPRLGPASRNPGLNGTVGNADDKLASPGVPLADDTDHYQPESFFGFDPQVTGRRANSHIAAAFFDALFWDGRAESTFRDPETGQVSIPSGGALESQAVGPIVSSIEMAHEGRTWDQVRDKLEASRPLALAWDLTPDLAAALASNPSYGDLFEDAFGDPEITAERIAFAIATYERTLIPDQTPWDDFMNGQNNALTPQQQQGRNAFNGPARCNQCHSGPLFSDGNFRNVGLRPIAEDNGRQAITGNFGDRGRFKVPSLRNVALRGRWFHNGDPGINSLFQAVRFYDNGGGPNNANEDPILQGLNVPPQVAGNIAAFLNALTDPRVAAELPPFDRPRLNSERASSGIDVSGSGVAGTGGFVPQLITHVPANVGNSEFKLGVQGALGGARAYVRSSFVWPNLPGAMRGISPQPFPRRVVTLEGTGAGEGYGTFRTSLPGDPALIGTRYTMQWIVADPAAPRNRAKSPVATLTLF